MHKGKVDVRLNQKHSQKINPNTSFGAKFNMRPDVIVRENTVL